MHTCGPWARLAGNCLQKYVCAPHFVCFYRTHWGWLVCTKTPWQAEGTLKPGSISRCKFIPWKMLQKDGSLSVSLVWSHHQLLLCDNYNSYTDITETGGLWANGPPAVLPNHSWYVARYLLITYKYWVLGSLRIREGLIVAWDKMCKMSQKFKYQLDSGSGCPKESRTHFGIDVGPF